MKRLLAILISMYFLLTIVGIEISIHYCHGHLTSIEFLSHQADCCCADKPACSADNEEEQCCEDDSLILMFEPEQLVYLANKISVPDSFCCSVPSTLIKQFDTFTETLSETSDRPPPGKESIWLLYSSFIFYG